MSLRTRASFIIASAVAVGLLVGAPASANVAQGYVVGAGGINDDFGDEGPLSRTTNNHSNVVGMWQGILFADGYLADSGRDCWFGPATEAATKAWQQDHGLDDDGIVGPLTFGKADDYLYWDGNEIWYDGGVRNIGKMLRDSQGRYYQQNADGTKTYGSYTASDAAICS